MPRVPEYGSFQVTPEILPAQQINAIDPKAVALAGQMSQQGIKNAQQAQARLNSVAVDIANEANGLRVKEMINQLRAEEQRLTYDEKEGYLTQQGGNALNRGDKGSLDQEYGTRLKTYGDKLRGALGNDAQRQMFDEASGTVYTNFGSGIQKHLLQQYYVYGDSVRQAEADRIAQGMILSDDPEVIAQGVNDLVGIAHEHSRVYGTEVDVNKLTSPVLQRVISAKIQGGYLGTAKRMMDTFKGHLKAEDISVLKKAWQEESETAQANNAALKAFQISQEKGKKEAAEYLAKVPYNIKTQTTAFYNGLVHQDQMVRQETDERGTARAVAAIDTGKQVSRSQLIDMGLSEDAQKRVLDYQLDTREGKTTATHVPTYLDAMGRIQRGEVRDYEKDVMKDYYRFSAQERTKLEEAYVEQQQEAAKGKGTPLMNARVATADAAERYYKDYKKKHTYTPEEILQVRESADRRFMVEYQNTGKIPADPKAFALGGLVKGDGASWLGGRKSYFERLEDNTEADFTPRKEEMTFYRGRYTQSQKWANKPMDDLTLQLAVASDSSSPFYGRGKIVRKIEDLIITTQAPSKNKPGVILTRQQARQIALKRIAVDGQSYLELEKDLMELIKKQGKTQEQEQEQEREQEKARIVESNNIQQKAILID